MLLAKIETHNEVNGVAFSVAEFALIALVIAPFALSYLAHARVVYAVVAVGIVANALTAVAIGARALANGQRGGSIARWFDRDERAALASRYPSLTRDTLIVAATTLVPFVLLLRVGYESIATRRRSG